MALKAIVPVIIGVGDIKNKSLKVEDAVEPMQLMRQAILRALDDTGLSSEASHQVLSDIDSVNVVATWSWNYPDLPGLLSEQLGIRPRHKTLTPHGGNYPVELLDQAARRISLGESNVSVVTGGEALASLRGCAAAKVPYPPGWSAPKPHAKRISTSHLTQLPLNTGTIHSIGLPIHVYPLYENGFRALRRQTLQQNNDESAQLYAEFAKVAEHVPMAWNYSQHAKSAVEIGTIGKTNRMICSPYPLLMNAFNTVNLAGACLLTSVEYATKLGIPEERWIYPLGGAGDKDHDNFWERPNFHSSSPLSNALDAALDVCNLSKDDIDVFDFYSCFPIVSKLACDHLGLPIANFPKPVTLLGGLTSFGGAGNNYSMHAIIEMVRELRNSHRQYGLILANGGNLTKHNVVCLSSQTRKDKSPYPAVNPLANRQPEIGVPPLITETNGEATIETYTVEFNREGMPIRGYVVGRLESGHRFVANHGDDNTLEQLSSQTKEQIGRHGWVKTDRNGKNMFVFDQGTRL